VSHLPFFFAVATAIAFVPRGEVAAMPTQNTALAPEDLWAAGRRIEAIERLHAEIAASKNARESAPLVRVTAWELEVHRYKEALADALVCGAPCDLARAEALYRLGDYALAVTLLSSTDPDQVLMKIDALEALERFDESDAVLAAAQKIVSSEDPRFQACDGRRLARLGQPAAAIAAFRRAVARDPLYAEALFGLGRALVVNGERDEGLKVLQRHRELLPLLDQLEFARRAVDLAPAHAPNWTAVADAQRALGRLDLAQAAYERAAALATSEQVVPNALRFARLLSDDRQDAKAAITMLERAHERVKDARLLVRAGDIARNAGQNELAIALYERALVDKPKDAEIQKRLDAAREKK
jgi:tetratricopeptide (TPR) repeat protein